MKSTFHSGLKTFPDLLHMRNFKRSEMWLKAALLPFALVANCLLFLVASVFFLIERLFSHVFKFFITLQAKLFQRKAASRITNRKYYTIFSVLVFIIFLPFIAMYYLSMLIKYAAKRLMKTMVFALDFSDAIGEENYLIFDDVDLTSGMQMNGMLKDLSQTSAIGSAFEEMLNQQSGTHGRHRHDDIDHQ